MGVTDKLIFGGVDSSTYGVYLTGSGTFGAPERDVQYVSVPGRNGDLILDNGRWNNIEVTYPANIPSGFGNSFASFRAAVCRKRGYQRLEDTYHPDEFRMAAFTSGFDPELTPGNHGGEFDIVFNCKPQRFLKSGETPIQFLPMCANGQTMETQFMPNAGDVTATVHCPANRTINIEVRKYNASKTQTSTSSYNGCGNNTTRTIPIGSTSTYVYWRMIVTGVDNIIDDVVIDLKFKTKIDGNTVDFDGKFARKLSFTNPTGYATKPLFEVYYPSLSSFTIRNYIGAVREEYYQMHVSTTGKTHWFIDCDTEYLYDDAGNNLTDKLTITTAESAIGEALVFPELGEETIEIYMQNTVPGTGQLELGIVYIYPRWWTL